MKEIYLVSGLGADRRVFDFIDLSDFKVHHIDWIRPVGNESIETYASRLLSQIKATKPIIIGVSFGGMIAIEIAKKIETEKIILISSAKTKDDIPLYFRIVGQLGLNKIIPVTFFKAVNNLTFWFFGTKTKSENELLKAIIRETDAQFLHWAIDKIVNWKNTTRLSNVTHIHGTSDHILPFKVADYEIQNGGHLMILNKGTEVSRLIQETLLNS